ncbi:MAG TPA: hypothetical protein VGX25_04330 [Actinophytocola sp.]|nr:hypothetical protein [Actinophytocola sp.]HEV2778607.1 hypothetical protein [Actinophytocola sp.]
MKRHDLIALTGILVAALTMAAALPARMFTFVNNSGQTIWVTSLSSPV